MRRQALCGESKFLRGLYLGFGRHRFRVRLAQAVQREFQRLRASLQRGDLGTVYTDRLLEAHGVGAHLLACDAGDLSFQE